MRTLIRTTLFAAMLLATVSAIDAQVSIGIRIGPPPPPRVVQVLPERPAPEFVWVDGYWYPVGRHYRWHGGYWTGRPYEGARWVEPHYDGERRELPKPVWQQVSEAGEPSERVDVLVNPFSNPASKT